IVLRIVTIRDDGADATVPRSLSIACSIIAFVGDGCARHHIGSDVEQHVEMAVVAGLAARQVERDRIAFVVGLEVDLGREAATRSAERLGFLPPFAPAADTCARTIVESNICTRCALWLVAASASK